MKKKFLTALLTAVAGCALLAGNAMAYPWDSLGGDWEVSTSMDYWTPTDLTTNTTGTSLFQIQVEIADFDSSFGLYTIDASGNVDEKFEVFSYLEEPLAEETITFKNEGGVFSITDNYDASSPSSTTWYTFDSVFGFYYDVYVPLDDGQGNIAGYINPYAFYTDASLNTMDVGIEHITTAYSEDEKRVKIYLEDLLAADADWDWEDMTVMADDLQPVPEPATMLLFGAGLAGLAGVARRKGQKK